MWVRRRGFNMNDTMLRMSLTQTVLILLVEVGAPWWAYLALLTLTAAAWPFRLFAPRTLILWDPSPEQRETMGYPSSS